ncbi:MAG: bifunctional phosphoribosylaminoimidazolecarboxamide formyltransferase/IMP cyclohydrolase [Deltaproteobacteria bacterium]|nr:bifunctional phosphoribosylaminoimidazolecarboxamide formyltransferase/IMP cyclohydrolase [Deltaproteobacteria bacterium]
MLKRAALVSVSDRSGLEPLCRALLSSGYQILATTGTAKILNSAGIETVSIEAYTGQNEILDGRVKTLHPKIHAGLLADRANPQHMSELESGNIMPIDIAVVNLYPFSASLSSEKAASPRKMVEMIDIGGPTMIRAAAKNFSGVLPLIDPADYEEIVGYLSQSAEREPLSSVPIGVRQRLSVKVFAALAQYNLEIARYFSQADAAEDKFQSSGTAGESLIDGVVLRRAQPLRYGENPHQKGGYYTSVSSTGPHWRQLQGKELSYNNFLDFDAAFRLIRAFSQSDPTAVILKHLNPCGAATADVLEEALRRAKLGDPRSHFGGVLAFNREVQGNVAEAIAEDFAEIVVAPAFASDARNILARKKNLRVIETDLSFKEELEVRSIQGGLLIQQSDSTISPVRSGRVVSKRHPSDAELNDLQFAWIVCASVKSNAITIAKGGMLLASGAGQMSRIDSVEVALHKCKVHHHDLAGAVAASDAFFPFPDCIEELARAGVSCVVAPHGAKRDSEVVAAADRLGIALIFTDDRHFKH